MADDQEEADDERAIELTTISAIYPELLIDPSDPFSATIEIPVDPVKPLNVFFPPPADGAAPANLPTPPDSHDQDLFRNDAADQRPQLSKHNEQESHQLSHLPPLKLRIRLPPEYPANQPPELELTADVPWLPVETLQRLGEDGVKMWEEMGHSQVLFAYIDHLREAAENGFDLASSSTEPLMMSSDLRIELLDYDIKAKSARFDMATFECGVCLGTSNIVALILLLFSQK